MNWIELAGTAVALAMDAFAVAMCRGLEMKKLNVRHLFLIALMFGLFQTIMPLIGWAVSVQFKKYIEPVDHWIAFGLLVFIGVKMIVEAFKGDEEQNCEKLNFKMLLLMSVATSIDALVVGITFVATSSRLCFPRSACFSAIRSATAFLPKRKCSAARCLSSSA